MTAPVLNLTIVGFTIIFGNFPNQSVAHQSNVRIAGRSEEFGDNYEEAILEILKTWEEF